MSTRRHKKRRVPRRRDSALHPRVMISGYYGFDNLGDELILRVLTDELKSRDIRVTVLSANPEKTARTYGVDAVHRSNVIDIIDALAYTNLFISGGGGLFQDATGPMSPLYYGGLIHLARFFEVPVCVWGQGVGPLKTPLGRWFTAKAFEQCERITVRDEKSKALLESLSDVVQPEVTADPVWLLDVKPVRQSRRKNRPWRVGISLRPWESLTRERLHALADCLKALVADSARPVEFVLLPFHQEDDRDMLEVFARHLEQVEIKGSWSLVSADDVIVELQRCDILLGMRFHSLVLGILMDIPVYGLVYDPKVAALLEQFRLQGIDVAELERLSPEMLQEAFDAYPVIHLKSLRRKAMRNVNMLERLLEIPEAELVL